MTQKTEFASRKAWLINGCWNDHKWAANRILELEAENEKLTKLLEIRARKLRVLKEVIEVPEDGDKQ